MSTCGDCGEDHQADGCGHATLVNSECHRSAILPCPVHFGQLHTTAMVSAQPTRAAIDLFTEAIAHLNGDGFIVSAWHVWLAMTVRHSYGREGTVPGGDVELPADAPTYLRQVAPLINFAVRATVNHDPDTVDAVLAAANRTLDTDGTLCMLMSLALSGNLNAEADPAVTTQHMVAYSMLGSQVRTGTGGLVLPYLVDMAVSLGLSKDQPGYQVGMGALRQLMALPGPRPLVTAVDVVARTLGQILAEDPIVLCSSGNPEVDGEVTGLVDMHTATPDNTPADVMPGVWTVRAAHAYGGATSDADATARIRQVCRDHGDPTQFAVDVVVGGTQMLGYDLAGAAARQADAPPGGG